MGWGTATGWRLEATLAWPAWLRAGTLGLAVVSQRTLCARSPLQGGQSYGAPKYPQQSYGQAGYGLYDEASASAAGAAGYSAGGKGDKSEGLYGGQVRVPAVGAPSV